jgi:hypothetical protein
MEMRRTSNPIKVVIGILAIAVIGIGILGIRNSYSARIDSKDELKTKTSNVEVDKTAANKELNKLYYALIGALDTGEVIQSRIGSGELLSNPMEKFVFTYFASYYNGDPNQSILDKNAYGMGVTGAYAVKLDYFKQYYRDLFDEEFDTAVLDDQSEYVIQDDYIYGSIMSGLSFSNTTLKFRSLNEKDGKYYLLIDCIVSDDDEYLDYAGDSIVDYPEDIITYNIKMVLNKKGNFYSIESMVAY